MEKSIIKLTNVQIPERTWFYSMSRDKLRSIARKHGIRRGRNKIDTSYNLSRGVSEDGELFKRVFEVNLSA
jgi:hypothetical protein